MLRLALIPVLLAGAAGAVGCEADGGDEGLLVLKNVAPSGTSCVFTGSETEAFFPHGFVTTQLKNDYGDPYYLINPQIKSRITALDGEEDLKTVILTGADIDIDFADPDFASGIDSSLLHFRQIFSAPVTPNGGIADAGFVLLPTELISAIAQAAGGTGFAIEVVATFVIHGNMSGADVKSQAFTYGVTVSDGGLANVVGPISPAGSETCSGGSATIRVGNPCNIAQDLPVDCCQIGAGASARFICPATP